MPLKKELLYQSARELRVQTSLDGSRIISGYAIRYNEPSSDLGGFTEIVAPGAVTESLKNSPDVLCLRDHDASILLGRTKSKTLSLTEDTSGLRFSCALPATSQASDLAASIDRGDLDGVSFGFVTVQDKWTSDGDGNVVRTLLQIDLFEVSPCSFPAYSTSSVRSCPPELRSLIRSKRDDEDDEEDEDEDQECDCDCDACLSGGHQSCAFDCDNDERAKRSLNWAERTLLRIEVARRK